MSVSDLTTPAPTSLVLRRTFNVPVERVFDAWLSPEAMRRFLVGAQPRVLDVKVDPHAGGSYSITWETDEGPWTVGGVYREIVKNERIVCTWTWEEDDPADARETLLTLEFRALGPKQTEFVLTHTNFSSEQSRDGHATGWTGIVDELAEVMNDAQ
jgi:uncharacterized protein YndB with AHSA1/START domain